MYLEDISVKLNVLYGEILFQEVTDTHAETMVRLKENCIHLELKTKSFCEMDEYDTCLSEDGYDSESGSFDEGGLGCTCNNTACEFVGPWLSVL